MRLLRWTDITHKPSPHCYNIFFFFIFPSFFFFFSLQSVAIYIYVPRKSHTYEISHIERSSAFLPPLNSIYTGFYHPSIIIIVRKILQHVPYTLLCGYIAWKRTWWLLCYYCRVNFPTTGIYILNHLLILLLMLFHTLSVSIQKFWSLIKSFI